LQDLRQQVLALFQNHHPLDLVAIWWRPDGLRAAFNVFFQTSSTPEAVRNPPSPLCTMHWCMGQLLLRPLYNLRFTKHHFPFHYCLQVLETLFQVENSLNEKAVIFCKKTFKNQFYF